jgi:hypothetical protein
MTTKALIERERADLKLRMEGIRTLAATPRRVSITTHENLLGLLREIEELAGPHATAEAHLGK